MLSIALVIPPASTSAAARDGGDAGADPSTAARCARCGTSFDAAAWSELELVARVAPQRVREFLTIWPDDTSIEVRRCVCGRALARKPPRAAAR